MICEGRVHRFGDNINTDYIISSKYKAKTLEISDMTKHIMEDIDPGFAARIQPGDILVAGENFGCGSSRETAPRVIKESGLAAVVASSFARIFFRNCVNIGLPLLRCDTSSINQDDRLTIDFSEGVVHNHTKGLVLTGTPLPKVMMNIIADGGLSAHVRRHKTFVLS